MEKSFLVADTQLYKRLCPSVRPLVRPLVRGDRVKKWENEHFRYFSCRFECGGGFGCGWGLDTPAHPSATIL